MLNNLKDLTEVSCQTSGALLAQYYTSLVQSNPAYRLAEVEVDHPAHTDPDTKQ